MLQNDSGPLQPLHQLHLQRLSSRIFRNADNGQMPDWLRRNIAELADRYGHVRTTSQFRNILEGFQKSQNEPLEIFIIGESKFGKSTLLNALLGKELSRVNFLPETRCFLRFVPSLNPRGTARVFARLLPGMHDWLLPHLGIGQPVHHLFQLQEYLIPEKKIDQLLSEETKRSRSPDYETAIYELEREVPIPPLPVLNFRVRIVDTQGLNQILPDDLEKLPSTGGGETTVERFKHWLATTPRGRHLHWQYRRCHTVVWVAHARRANSAVTLHALQLFSKFKKTIIMVVTHIDTLGGSEELNRVMSKIRETYGQHIAAIVPVNGKAALEAVLGGGNSERLRKSGLLQVAEQIQTRCIDRAAIVRWMSDYSAMRVTEHQLRQSLRVLHHEIERNLDLLKCHRLQVEALQDRLRGQAAAEAKTSAERHYQTMRSNAQKIEMAHGGLAATRLLNAREFGSLQRSLLEGVCIQAHQEAKDLAQSLAAESYRLPMFDADGHQSGDSLHLKWTLKLPILDFSPMHFDIQLNSDNWAAFTSFLKIKILGLISESIRKEAEQVRKKALEERQANVMEQTQKQWGRFCDKLLQEADQKITLLFKGYFRDMDAIEAELNRHEGCSLKESRSRIQQALADKVMKQIPVRFLLRTALPKGIPPHSGANHRELVRTEHQGNPASLSFPSDNRMRRKREKGIPLTYNSALDSNREILAGQY